LTIQFDNYDLPEFAHVAAAFGHIQYGYVVTPNADHLIRLHRDASFRALYASANFILLDSRFVSHCLRIAKGLRLPVCTGSDLTETLFAKIITPEDGLVLIGSTDLQARRLVARYGLLNLAHYDPPMGFVNDPDAIETCLRFIESHSPFRFCLLAVGAPQQEILAQRLQVREEARGLAICVGASINFLTGLELRAPIWMQRVGMEWLFRLAQDPRRMSERYLVRGPRVFNILRTARITLRMNPSAPLPRILPTTPTQALRGPQLGPLPHPFPVPLMELTVAASPPAIAPSEIIPQRGFAEATF
jgi:exopolysaccharide biosynthesis WecB/TagA/CpsF family protein